ncbi:MAG: insulinase family protein, partial [Planctomycetota bacterium]
LNMLSSILGDGRSSRLYQALVGNEKPIASVAQAGNQQLQDKGVLLTFAGLLPGTDPDAAEQAMADVVKKFIAEGPTEEELAKVKTQAKLNLINSVATATSVATKLGEEAVFGGDPEEVNRAAEKIEAVTAEDVQRVAAKYLTPERLSILHYRPGTGEDFDSREAPATQPAAAADVDPTLVIGDNPPAKPVADGFPTDWPTEPPYNTDALTADFVKGETFDVNGVKVIVLPDDRLPTVTWDLILPTGGHAEPADKDGLAGMTASMLTRGIEGMTAAQLSERLEASGISLSASDNGDHTRITGRTTVDQFALGVDLTKRVITTPTFPDDEFAKLKAQAQSGLTQSLVDPSSVAGREMSTALYGDSPLGRSPTMESLAAITPDDVKAWYAAVYQPAGAMLLFAGDVDTDTARKYAEQLTSDWSTDTETDLVAYGLPEKFETRRIIIVDNPTGQQAEILMGIRAYDNQSDDRFAGSVASQILSNGIDSRMNQYLRAEKGLTYGASAYFAPGRLDGRFVVSVATKPESAADAITSSFEVLEKMIAEPVTVEELEEAQQIVAGFMVMQTQTIGQQAGRRVTIELNDYPIDYYDTLPARVNEVTLDDVQAVMAEHVDPSKFTIVIVGPAEKIKPQLESMGQVEVMPMPLQR